MPYIDKLTMPSGTTYDLHDSRVDSLSGYTKYLGVTTTVLTDGATTNPIKVSDADVTATEGGIATYQSKEFIFNGTSWQEFGDLSGLGALAYKDSASGSYTPAGSVSQPTFTGTDTTSTGKFTPAGSVSLTNTNRTATVSPAASGTATYTPAGTVAAPTISVKTAGTTTTIKNPTSQTVAKTVATAAPGTTAPANAVTTADVSGTTLRLYQVGYTTGASITTSNVTVKNGDPAYEASAPAFTGTGVRLVTGNIAVPSSASFTGTEGEVSVSGKPSGTVSKPTFAGTAKTVTVS